MRNVSVHTLSRHPRVVLASPLGCKVVVNWREWNGALCYWIIETTYFLIAKVCRRHFGLSLHASGVLSRGKPERLTDWALAGKFVDGKIWQDMSVCMCSGTWKQK